MSGPLGGRPTLPILGNLLLQVADGTLSLTGTDLEMEMVARVALVQPHEPGATTVPARKFFDICRGLPEGAEIAVQLEGERMLVQICSSVSYELFPNVHENGGIGYKFLYEGDELKCYEHGLLIESVE